MKELSPGQRLRQAITESGMSQRRIALAVGLEPQSITNALRRDRVSADLARAVATVTGHRWEWLFKGEPPQRREEASELLRPVSQSPRLIPVISLTLAGGWPRSVKEASPMHSVTIDHELAAELGDTAFCLVVEDDSMRDATAESVQRGDKVIIDPKTTPMPGDLVVAMVEGQAAAVFRKYRERGQDASGHTQVELVPLNSDYATETITVGTSGRIVGVMVEHRRQRRQTR